MYEYTYKRALKILRDAVHRDKRSIHRIGRDAGIDQAAMWRLMHEKTTLVDTGFGTIHKLVIALDIEPSDLWN